MKTRKLIPLMAVALMMAAPAARADNSASVNNQQGGNQHQQRDGFMKRIDTNKDGAISKDEFTAAQLERFTKMDKNNDGKLSKDEMASAREMFVAKKHHRGDKGGKPGKDANNDGDGLLNQ